MIPDGVPLKQKIMGISNGVGENFEDFAKKIITKENLLFYINQINLLQGIVFKKVKTPLSARTEGKVDEKLINYIQELERKEMLPHSPNQQLAFLEELKKYLLTISQVRIEIAFTPSENFIFKIAEWLKKNLHQKMILDLAINPRIVGGAIIEYQGKYCNFSLVKKINQLISKPPKKEL